MTNTTREGQEQLAAWLNRLIEILRLQGGETWLALVQIASGKTAAIALDGIALEVTAVGGDALQLLFNYALSPNSINFRSDADTLRDIVAGRLTLDAALANGKIYARNHLDELLSMYKLVMRILADSATNPQLQELWMEFDSSRSASATRRLPSLLEGQKPSYGYFIKSVPEDVLAIEVEP
ncbi:MAG: hypothetical protein SXA11_22390 [Cyanobacteriota bacterium]|nr:hypothetical protein [Cyanobacteriota bacterium]